MKKENTQKKKEGTKANEEKVVGTMNNTQVASTRGRIFEGYVKKKFPKRVVIEFERPVYVRKYERYLKLKTKLHARVMPEMEPLINVGDYVQIRECRPLSKIIHFILIKKIRDASQAHNEAKDKTKKIEDKGEEQ